MDKRSRQMDATQCRVALRGKHFTTK